MDENGQIFKKYLKYLIFPKNGKIFKNIFFKYLNVFPSSIHEIFWQKWRFLSPYFWLQLDCLSVKSFSFGIISDESECHSGIKDTLVILWIELSSCSKFPRSLQVPFQIHQKKAVMQMHWRVFRGHFGSFGEPRFSLRMSRFLQKEHRRMKYSLLTF